MLFHSVTLSALFSSSILTLLASQQSLDALDEFVSVTVGVDADLLQLFVTHVCQHIQ